MKKIFIILIILIATHAKASQITQTIKLSTGWNAVFIEIAPIHPKPDILFKDLPVDQVFTYHTQKTSVQFIQEPDEIEFNKDGWNRWVPAQQNDAFLNNIFNIFPGQAYLIHATNDHIWQLTGNAHLTKQVWQPDSFNLKGFYVNPEAPPTFASYFQYSQAHASLTVFSLINSHWQQITDIENTPIESGKAYWIYSKGGSDYNGPLKIDLSSTLNFNIEKLSSNIHCFNRTQNPLEVQFQLMTDSSFPLLRRLSSNSGKIYYKQFQDAIINILPEKVKKLSLAIKSGSFSESMNRSVLKITDDAGTRLFIPVSYQ